MMLPIKLYWCPLKFFLCIKNYWCPLKFFLCIKNKGRFPRLEFDLFSLFRLAKEKYNDEQRYTFYRTAAVWSADFFT